MNEYCAVVIPVYASTDERLNYFKDCLSSVVRQSSPTIAVIVDDGSPKFDEVQQIVRNQNNNSFRLVQRERSLSDKRTASNAINHGLELILDNSLEVLGESEQGKVRGVCYLHSDDMLTKTSVSDRMSLLKPDSFVYSNLYKIDSDSRPIGKYGCGNSIPKSAGNFPHHTVMWDIDFLRELKGYVKEEFKQDSIFNPNISAGEDLDVSLSSIDLAKRRQKEILFFDGFTYLYRKQGDDSIGSMMSFGSKMKNLRDIYFKHNLSTLSFFTARMGDNLPYSLFTYFPERFKAPFRHFKNTMEKKDDLCSERMVLNDPLLNI